MDSRTGQCLVIQSSVNSYLTYTLLTYNILIMQLKQIIYATNQLHMEILDQGDIEVTGYQRKVLVQYKGRRHSGCFLT
jgi:hypothetical protein